MRSASRPLIERHLGDLVADALLAARRAWGTHVPVCPTVFEIYLAPADFSSLKDRESLARSLKGHIASRAGALNMVSVGEVEVHLWSRKGVRESLPEIVVAFRADEHSVVDELAGGPFTNTGEAGSEGAKARE